ncbi:class I SAM-dependent methyltransferase [Methylocystis sp. WRRC1]|uniref:class I SAM-dependent methyltransferase n=1 Tax=Methylocystis sp. WRRC1 TaxID=1732014 RepID=UPI001D1508C8|nr:class I SAM-dependent methyltransferase [Methylocystis sp. WRRC1]MCC3245474.1 class I SAM-dependent methyltransferase [Methylocystis sp. WRRC1]
MIIWQAENIFEIDGVQFRIDFRAGKDRALSTVDCFTFVKTRKMVNLYRQLIQRKPKHILELGMFQGGSSVFYEKLYNPEKIVGVELNKNPIPALEAHIARGSVIKPYYGVSQSDREKLDEIIPREFPEGLDIIIDDASHLYEFSKPSFEICFPYLKPGGLYILEDWAWSHRRPSAAPTHPWYQKPALTNLIFEFVVSVAGPSSIAKVEIHSDVAIITKINIPAYQTLPALNVTPERLRDRPLPQI